MLHIFTVTIETEHLEGKFLSTDEVRELIADVLDAHPDMNELQGAEGIVEVTTYEVVHDDEAVAAIERERKRARAQRRREARKAATQPCTCACATGGFCGGCGHAGCGGR